MLGAGILRLVEQQVIDAEIELVEHPGGGGALEQRQRAVDQVVIVEQAAPRLLAPVAHDHLMRDRDQRAGAVAAFGGAQGVEQGADALFLAVETFGDLRMLMADACW